MQNHSEEVNVVNKKDYEDEDRNNDGWTKVKGRKRYNTKLGLSGTSYGKRKPNSRKYWNILDERDTCSNTEDSDISSAEDETKKTEQRVCTLVNPTPDRKRKKRNRKKREILHMNTNQQDTILLSNMMEKSPSNAGM